MAQLGEVVFALERFELSAEECLEVVGRWEGLEGRRIGRPALTVVEMDGRRRRLAALPGGQLSSTHPWRAAFAWNGDVSSIERAELELGRRLVVELPPPRRRRRRSAAVAAEQRALQPTEAAAAVAAPLVEPISAPETMSPPEPIAPAPTNGVVPAEPDSARAELEAQHAADRAELASRIAALEQELSTARAEAADLRERLQTARDGIIDRDRRLMTLQESGDRAAEDASARLAAERAEAAEVRTKLAEAREEAERARTEATAALAAEAAETERMRGELQAARRQADEVVATERAETARLREQLAARADAPASEDAPAAKDAVPQRMLDRVTRDLERERATNRTLRRDLEAVQAGAAELRRAAAVTPGSAEQPQLPQRRPVAAHRVDVARAAGAHLVPEHHPSPVRLWGARLAAVVLVGLLLLALALIVAPLL